MPAQASAGSAPSSADRCGHDSGGAARGATGAWAWLRGALVVLRPASRREGGDASGVSPMAEAARGAPAQASAGSELPLADRSECDSDARGVTMAWGRLRGASGLPSSASQQSGTAEGEESRGADTPPSSRGSHAGGAEQGGQAKKTNSERAYSEPGIGALPMQRAEPSGAAKGADSTGAAAGTSSCASHDPRAAAGRPAYVGMTERHKIGERQRAEAARRTWLAARGGVAGTGAEGGAEAAG